MHKEIVRIFDKILFVYASKEDDSSGAGIGFGNSIIEVEKLPNGNIHFFAWKNIITSEGYSVIINRKKMIPNIKFQRHFLKDVK